MESVVVNANARPNTGKKANKAVRNEGLVPCVIYGGEKNVTFSGEPLAFRDLVYTSAFKLAEINLEGNKYSCIIKDIQFHPVTDEIVHIDFLELVPNQKLIASIPVVTKGQAPGVKIGGRLNQKVRAIKVKTTPEKLVSELFVDISTLELDQSVRVRDVEVAEGMQVMNAPAIPVATIEVPRALRAAAAAAESE